MPVPLIAAAMIPEITKIMASSGASKDNNILDFQYQPMIKVRKNQTDLLKKYPEGEYPDPHFPAGIRIAIPAWFFIVAGVAGISVGTLLVLEWQGKLGPLKEALGLKKKSGALGLGGFLGL